MAIDLFRKRLEELRVLNEEHSQVLNGLVEIIFKYTGARLAPNDLVWRGRSVLVKARPLLRNEVILKRLHILREVARQFGRRAPLNLL